MSNISWRRVDDVTALFQEGDRVRCVVIGMDAGFTRISVSTKDLEAREGDMLTDRHSVFDGADETVQRFRQHIQKWEEKEMQREQQAAARR